MLPAASAMYKDRVPSAGSFVPRLVEAKIKVPGQEPRSLNDSQIVAQAYSMILAGYTTPPLSLPHCFLLLVDMPHYPRLCASPCTVVR